MNDLVLSLRPKIRARAPGLTVFCDPLRRYRVSTICFTALRGSVKRQRAPMVKDRIPVTG
ncbi:hypothetical protein RJ40_06755 [Methanofollis aquaemaris]|uniref:Uncharacterized protein n=1 Tax=Methanofollis aquaemaris TaxID=126734 RepID=A0A8A3S6A3_9EURY|nr:hypothetical protein [Methanofollis aquaemaris]QSZ67220.1 hypothetical protein RJ40_06755 [Methanofollis aquaemaris]